MTTLTGRQIAAEGLAGWTYLTGGLQTRVHTGAFAAGLSLVDAIGAAAEDMGHHPELTLRREHVEIRLTSPDQRGVTDHDVRLARVITEIAAAAGVRLDAVAVSRLEFALDSPAHEAVISFWAAVSAMEDRADEVVDPADRLPAIWFQESGSEEPRQRWHPDIWVDPAQVRPRIDAALAAGGRLVSDAAAPSYWVLADPEGNRVCLCTWQQRGGATD